MSALTRTWLAVTSVAVEHPAGLFVLVLAASAFVHTAVGLGRARQWYVLPVIFGLTALVGFLLNPFADANTAADLRIKLTSYETLTLLCIVQFVLLAASLSFGIRLDHSSDEPRCVIGLTVVHAIPVPLVLVAMLLVEQGRLAEFPGARPESVGREVGFVVAAILTLTCATAMIIPRRWLVLPHHVLSIAMLLACMFVPGLQDPLPQPMSSVNLESVHLLWKVGLVATATVLVGCCWPSMPFSGLFRRLAQRLSIGNFYRSESIRGMPWEF